MIRWRDLQIQPFAGREIDREAKRATCPTRQRLDEEREQLPRWHKRTGTRR